MNHMKISDSEWKILDLVWANEGTTLPALMALLPETGWNKNTVHTFLTRLCNKGLVRIDKSASPHRYFTLVPREECERGERDNFLQKVYNGSVGLMVASFLQESTLSRDEVEELKKMLDEMEV